MLSDARFWIYGSLQAQQRASVKLCWTRISFHQLPADDLPPAAERLSTGCFSCRLSLAIRGIKYRNNAFAEEAPLGGGTGMSAIKP